MINLWLSTNHTHYGDDVESDFAVDMSVMNIVIDGYPEALQLMIVDSLFGFSEQSVASGLHLDKHHLVVVSGDDVDIPAPRFPVAFDDAVA